MLKLAVPASRADETCLATLGAEFESLIGGFCGPALIVERRLEKKSKVDIDARSATRAERMFNDGKFDDEVVVREIEHKNLEFATQALSLMAKLKKPLVRRVIDARNGKSVTSLV
jgi:hypothetical protein